MSDGATIWQPDCAKAIACSDRTSTVASFTILSDSKIPSWPWVVYGSSATSQMIPRSGTSARSLWTDLPTKFSGFSASSPRSLFKLGSVSGNSASAGIPRSAAYLASKINWSIDNRNTPGIDSISDRTPVPSVTKTGQIKSLVARLDSRTRRRNHAWPRLRRILVFGNSELANSNLQLARA